ncbi:MAG: type II toxin-antitoxin system RelE/ParE family toxin [Rhodopirellula sp.]|nr:type II toxin-antitoxin system RelE/ParE family toxin [Rhodopirellula sp.]
MNHRFHPATDQELIDASQFYESRLPGLGGEFLDEIEASLESVLKSPSQFEVLDGDVRIARTQRFPYGLLFVIEPDEILIVAVMHLHRRPGYWEHRVR